MKGVSTPSNLLDQTHTSDFLPSQIRKNKIFKQIQNEDITGWNSGNSPTQFGGDNDHFYNNNIADRYFEINKVEDRLTTKESAQQQYNLYNFGNSKPNIFMDGHYPSENFISKYPGQTNALKELSNNLQIHKQQKKNIRYGGANYDQAMHQFTQQPLPLNQKGKRKSQQFSSLSNNQSNNFQQHGTNNFTNVPSIVSPNEDFSSIVNELKQLKEFLTSPLPQDHNQNSIQKHLLEASHQLEGGNEGRPSSVDSQERDYSDANNTRKDFQIRRQRLNSFQVNTLQKQQQMNQVNVSYDNLKLRKSQHMPSVKQYTNQSNEEQQNYATGIAQSTNFQQNGIMINLSSLTGQVANSAVVNHNNYTLHANQKKLLANKANSLEYRRKRGNTIDLLPKISEMQRYQNTIKTSRIGTLKTNENSQKSRIGMNKISTGDNYDIQKDQICKTSDDRSSQATINQIKKLMNKERIYYKENFQQLESLKFPQSNNPSQNTTKQNSFFLKNIIDSNNTMQTAYTNPTLGDQNSNGQVIKIQNQNYSHPPQQFDDAQFTQESSYNTQYGNVPVNQFNSKFQISLAEYLRQNATQKQQFFNNQKKTWNEKKDAFDFNKNVKIISEKFSLNNILQHQESPRLKPHIPLNSSINTSQSRIGGGIFASQMSSVERTRQQSIQQQNQHSSIIESRQGLQSYSPIPSSTVQQSQQVIIQKGSSAYSPSNRDKQENENVQKYTQFNSRIPKKLKDLLQEQYVRESKLREIQLVSNNVI